MMCCQHQQKALRCLSRQLFHSSTRRVCVCFVFLIINLFIVFKKFILFVYFYITSGNDALCLFGFLWNEFRFLFFFFSSSALLSPKRVRYEYRRFVPIHEVDLRINDGKAFDVYDFLIRIRYPNITGAKGLQYSFISH